MRRLWWIAVLASCDAVHDRQAPTWSYIHAAIVAPNCATSSCHSRISSVAGMDLSTRTSAYAMLTGITCDARELGGEIPTSYVQDQFIDALNGVGYRRSGATLNPDGSTTYPADLLMPPDQPLSVSDIQLVVRWYEAGAPCD